VITETFARLFSGKKAKKNAPGLNADRHLAEEIDICPKCKSSDIRKTVWKPQGFRPRTVTRRTLDRYALGCEIEWDCSCGFHHNGPLFKQ